MEIMMHGHIFLVFFFEITQYNSDTYNARTLTPPYEHTYANPIPMSIFEDWAGKSSRLLYLGHFQLFKLKNEVAGLQGKLCLEFISKYSSGFSVKCDEPYVDILGREFLVKRWSISASLPNFETCSVPSILYSLEICIWATREIFFFHDSLDACRGTVRPTMGQTLID